MATESLEDRVKRLERRYRFVLGSIGLAVLAGAMVWVVAGATSCTQAGKVIRVRELILEDEKGMPRAMLTVTEAGPGLKLSDEKGNPRAGLGVTEAGPGLVLFNKNSETHLVLFVVAAGPGLVLFDENGMSCATLAMAKDGPRLRLSDEKGKVIWSAP